VTPPSSRSELYGTGSATAEPVARLPGITVVGSGQVEVPADTAVVRMTVGSGSGFDGPNATVKLVDEKRLDPLVDTLVEAGASKDDIYVNTFGGSDYGPNEDSAVIVVEWPRPRKVKDLLAKAQRAIRARTPYNLQNVAVAFKRDDCASAEAKAMRAALDDARRRAERLAALSHAKLGRLIAVSQATSAGLLTAFTSPMCNAADTVSPGLLEYQAAAATADKVPVTATLEVTFAITR
jgi:uncharacterized protein YggE